MDEKDRVEERLPPAARVYLDVWGMGVTPEGKAIRVETAAQLAGVSVSAVKHWRANIEGFRQLEEQARKSSSGWSQRLARRIVEGLVAPAGVTVRAAIEGGDAGLGWQVLKATGAIADVVDLGGAERLAEVLRDLRELDDGDDHDDLDDLEGLG